MSKPAVYAMPYPLTAAARRALLLNAANHFAGMAVLLLVLAAMVSAALDLRTMFIFKALLVFAGASLLFVPSLLRDHPFGKLGPANRVTLGRGMLTALTAGFLGETTGATMAYVIVALGLTSLVLDGFDGSLARRTGMASPFGARFDMETDALLVLLFGLLAWTFDKAGPWVIVSGLLRYLFVMAGWFLPWMRAALPSSRRRQTVCVIQIAVMLAVLLPFVTSPLSDALAAVTLFILCCSFFVDVAWLTRARTSAGPASTLPVRK